jgi:alkylmercury lyase
MRTSTTPADLTDRLIASVNQPGSARTSPFLYRVLLQLLAHGEPITIGQLAAAADQPDDDVRRIVNGWLDTEYDQQGRIEGHGLTLRPTPYQFIVDGKYLYTWCALDTLFFPAVIGRLSHVESPCATTGTPVRLTVDPAVGGSVYVAIRRQPDDPPSVVAAAAGLRKERDWNLAQCTVENRIRSLAQRRGFAFLEHLRPVRRHP